MDYKEICRKAIEKYGIVAQIGMMHEEMCELSVALEHWKRGRCKKEDVVTEIADVMIVAAQMALYFGKKEVDAEIDRKLERLEGKMKGESEDERIRKKMIEHFKSKTKDTWGNMPVKSILAWLEKLKEQKPVEKPSKEEYVKRFKVLCDAYEIKLPNREYDIYHLCDDLSKLSVDSGKQKPAEWREEDEKKLSAVISLMRTSRAVDPFYDKMCLEGWLKSLRPQPHWNPSEEQMNILAYAFTQLKIQQCYAPHVYKSLESLYIDLKNYFSL